jgi:hypothetical protein
MSKYIEPRLRRDFGGIISAFFDFLKGNIKGLINMFVGYNGIFFILFLVSVYFLITGFVEYLVIENSRFYNDGAVDSESAGITMAIAFFLLLASIIVATIFNYTLCSSYLSIYATGKKINIDKKEAWRMSKRAFWGIVLVAVCTAMLYIVFFIAQLVLAFIPILGSFASIFLSLGFNAWISLTIFSYVHNQDKSVFDAFGEAWQLLFSGFWKTIGVNFVVGLLLQVCFIALQIVPFIIVGVVFFHAIDDGSAFTESTFSHVLLIVFLTLFCVTIMFVQMLSQLVNGFLYFNLHENKHNEYLRARIEKLDA